MVPDSEVERAKRRARRVNLHKQIMFLSLESFFDFKLIMMACDERRDAYDVFSDIVALYNQRLAELNADPAYSLQLN